LIQNEYSVHLPAEYEWEGRKKKSFINIVNPFRGTLVLGSPGSGKTWFIIQRFIKQQIQMGFSMLVYD
jgi:Ni2+-binding GTPase involved in maturation of urease and hydrogenase